MLKNTVIIGIFLFTLNSFSQENKVNENLEIEKKEEDYSIYEIETVQISPIFPGCELSDDKLNCFKEKINNHIFKRFTYPVEAQEKSIQGKVIINLLIENNGVIIIDSAIGPNIILEKEARRILDKLPIVKPGMQNNKFVGTKLITSVTFKIS
ncbi:MAG: energy transducer TonB [Flavobacterium sp.]